MKRARLTPEAASQYSRELHGLSESGRELAKLIHNAAVPEAAVRSQDPPAPVYVSIAFALQTNGALRSMVAQLIENMRKEAK